MKRVLFGLLAGSVAVGLCGCCSPGGSLPHCLPGSCAQCPEDCATCDYGCEGCGPAGCQVGDPAECEARFHPNAGLNGLFSWLRGGRRCEDCTPGPAAGTITYPYYTLRGPRDFLAAAPPGVGP